MESDRMAASDRQLVTVAPEARTRPLPRAGLTATMLESYCLLWLGTLLAAILAIPIAGQLRGVFAFRFALAPAGTASMAALIAANNIREAEERCGADREQDQLAGVPLPAPSSSPSGQCECESSPLERPLREVAQ